jgi:DNA invertase Pin-like site-specific DNA recombinase
MKVAIYICRYIGWDADSPTYVDEQLKLCREYAERNEYEVVGEYIDHTYYNGGAYRRPKYGEMFQEQEKTQFRGILTICVDPSWNTYVFFEKIDRMWSRGLF